MKHVALLLGTKKNAHTKNTYTYKRATGNTLIQMYYILIKKTSYLWNVCENVKFLAALFPNLFPLRFPRAVFRFSLPVLRSRSNILAVAAISPFSSLKCDTQFSCLLASRFILATCPYPRVTLSCNVTGLDRQTHLDLPYIFPVEYKFPTK